MSPSPFGTGPQSFREFLNRVLKSGAFEKPRFAASLFVVSWQFKVEISERVEQGAFEFFPSSRALASVAGHDVNLNFLNPVQIRKRLTRLIDRRGCGSPCALTCRPDVDDTRPTVFVFIGLVCQEEVHHLGSPMPAANNSEERFLRALNLQCASHPGLILRGQPRLRRGR